MTIISCIKQVRDLDIVLKDDWFVAEDGRSINIDYANLIMNTFDETALELMLRLKDADDELKSTVVTVGPVSTEKLLLKALALGVDTAVRIDAAQDLDFRPRVTAHLLKDAVSGEPDAEIVLCGRQADNGSNGLTGQLLAEMLGWPCYTMVIDLVKNDAGYKISRLLPDGVEHFTVKPPFVAAVTQTDNKLLRMAGLREILEAKKKPIQRLTVDMDKGPWGDYKTKFRSLSIMKSKKNCQYIEENENQSKSAQLIEIIKDRVEHGK